MGNDTFELESTKNSIFRVAGRQGFQTTTHASKKMYQTAGFD
jgi:hypothetical protein